MAMEPQAEQAQPEVEETMPAAEPAQETSEAADDQASVSAEPITPFSWQASEYVHHQKGPMWYAGLVAVLALLTVVAVLTREWLAIAVFVCMFLAVVVYGSRQPRTLNYVIDQDGINIEGKSYAFSTFRSFSVVQDVAWHVIDLEPTQRFMPRLTLLLDNDHVDEIVGRLESQLPRLDRKPDAIERAARFLRF